jgi:hypothetical protein
MNLSGHSVRKLVVVTMVRACRASRYFRVSFSQLTHMLCANADSKSQATYLSSKRLNRKRTCPTLSVNINSKSTLARSQYNISYILSSIISAVTYSQ